MKLVKGPIYIQPDARGRIQLPKELRSYPFFKLQEKGLRFELIPLRVEEEPETAPRELWLQEEVSHFLETVLFPKLRRFLEKEKLSEARALFLYGSRARGDALSRSDFDFGILCEDMPNSARRHQLCDELQNILKDEFSLLKNHGVEGEPTFHFFSCTPPEREITPIYFSIACDGQMIWEKQGCWSRFLKQMASLQKKLKVQALGTGRLRKWIWQNKS
jgi:predicted nucleotidyltransferase